MAVDWTPHRFSGGVLALDVANTVVLRLWPDKRFDRFDEAFEISRFAEAASRLRPDEFGKRPLHVADAAAAKPGVVALREATDALFRDVAETGAPRAALLTSFLRAAAGLLDGQEEALALEGGTAPLAFEAAFSLSALALLDAGRRARIRACPNCAWLFLDRSRNGSRTWCDMAVCGNREKARRHYVHRKEREQADA